MELERKIIFGKHPVAELLDSNSPIEKIFMLQQAKGTWEIEIRKICKERNIPLIKTKAENINRLCSGGNHQGIVAITSAIAFQELENIIPHIYENEGVPFLLLLDHITDVRNMGAICRTAEAFGAHALILPKKGSAAINEETVKASSGAIFNIPVCRTANINDAIDFLKLSGISVMAAQMGIAKSISEVSLDSPVAIVLGSEGHGIQKDTLLRCDEIFQIPITGKTQSLNVGVAAGIVMYELTKQRSYQK